MKLKDDDCESFEETIESLIKLGVVVRNENGTLSLKGLSSVEIERLKERNENEQQSYH